MPDIVQALIFGPIYKQSAEALDIAVDFAAELSGEEISGLPVVTSTLIADGSDTTANLIAAGGAAPFVPPGTKIAQFRLINATAGEEHKVHVKVSGANGQIIEADGRVVVTDGAV